MVAVNAHKIKKTNAMVTKSSSDEIILNIFWMDKVFWLKYSENGVYVDDDNEKC